MRALPAEQVCGGLVSLQLGWVLCGVLCSGCVCVVMSSVCAEVVHVLLPSAGLGLSFLRPAGRGLQSAPRIQYGHKLKLTPPPYGLHVLLQGPTTHHTSHDPADPGQHMAQMSQLTTHCSTPHHTPCTRLLPHVTGWPAKPQHMLQPSKGTVAGQTPPGLPQ